MVIYHPFIYYCISRSNNQPPILDSQKGLPVLLWNKCQGIFTTILLAYLKTLASSILHKKIETALLIEDKVDMKCHVDHLYLEKYFIQQKKETICIIYIRINALILHMIYKIAVNGAIPRIKC